MTKQDQWCTSIDEAWAIFKLHCRAQRYRPSTIGEYERKLRPFLNWANTEGASHIEGITSRHCRAYLVEKQTIKPGTPQERSASGNYVHGIARCLKTFFNFCVAEKWIAESPMSTVKMPKRPKKILDAFAADDIHKLTRALQNDRERALFFVLLDTGIRATECANLRAEHVDIAGNCITVLAGKGEKDRVVYFGAKTARYLVRLIRNKEGRAPLWVNERTGKPLTYWGINFVTSEIGERVGIQCNPHKFRRTFAINSLRNGMNIYTLARLMGHEDISILRPYLDILDTDLRSSHQQYGVVDNL